MSSHGLLTSEGKMTCSELSFNESGISTNGFLPDQAPLQTLPDPYYAPWERLVQHLPACLKNQTLRSEVGKLPLLSVNRLATEPEWRRAYVMLVFLAHAYIWGGVKPAEILPSPITVPLLKVSAHLGLPPVATYAALNLWNFSSSHMSDLTRLDNLHALHTFTETEDESWFYMISVAIEAQGARVIPLLLRALAAAEQREYGTITRALHELSHCTSKMGALLDRMDERCDPLVFYHKIRPFLAGSKNMDKAGLPRGVFYDEGDEGSSGSWRQLRGGSNGQSSLIQLFDIVLGINHSTSLCSATSGRQPQHNADDGERSSFQTEFRQYMPSQHRRFLEHISQMDSIRDIVTSAPEQRELCRAFQTATRSLGEFRNKHLQIVTRYIIIPSTRPSISRTVNLATASSSSVAQSRRSAIQLTGTGGTALLPFLKQARDHTFQAGKAPAATR
ncbi:indoleamine-dioxygenase [Diplogelasinospora grovesii]|uniref:Indoleamine-dioxygenase n=1 Tax=Diplogelasinospora grovesii TaxID=303347 RepID=A0AAN6S8H2_9PEZI|nr:indoleamine-dioxygenase [Diplogelasinospora grovesii]